MLKYTFTQVFQNGMQPFLVVLCSCDVINLTQKQLLTLVTLVMLLTQDFKLAVVVGVWAALQTQIPSVLFSVKAFRIEILNAIFRFVSSGRRHHHVDILAWYLSSSPVDVSTGYIINVRKETLTLIMLLKMDFTFRNWLK